MIKSKFCWSCKDFVQGVCVNEYEVALVQVPTGVRLYAQDAFVQMITWDVDADITVVECDEFIQI